MAKINWIEINSLDDITKLRDNYIVKLFLQDLNLLFMKI
jgi:hypothetical protein